MGWQGAGQAGTPGSSPGRPRVQHPL